MPIVHLDNRALIDLSGSEAEHFLQNIVTTDLTNLRDSVALPGALLAPQGKILFDFLVSRSGSERLRLECRADVADDFVRRLMLYRLRAKVEITKQDEHIVAVAWEIDSSPSSDDSTASASGIRDRRFLNAIVYRHYEAPLPPANASLEEWTAFRVEQGIAESGPDYALNDAFPHDVLLDQTDGIGFKKGCYIGQEVVSRMQHRGTARRRVLIARSTVPLPASGSEISVNGRTIGTLGSVAGTTGLAVVRIDHVKDAMESETPILAGDAVIALSIPPWARFGFPEGKAASGGNG
ncbi:MAG TPA: folate-binding protein YgfZ [Rhizobiaceae bacterium]|nr:folate-binding protein YgfZ [Rhizobiaceae bacterium]